MQWCPLLTGVGTMLWQVSRYMAKGRISDFHEKSVLHKK